MGNIMVAKFETGGVRSKILLAPGDHFSVPIDSQITVGPTMLLNELSS